ncbi:DUF4864 domain-containing protein [Frigidibacter sp. MR17.24]|uniref:DUF4864 domain-containing protein n=1 Tax=Frigidibacter sp. MR17.24 TaxID=3127345 RepID=UPI003012D8FC
MFVRGFAVQVAVMMMPALPALAQAALPAQAGAAIEAEIGAQMQAFRDGDAAAAFGHASPAIRSMFGSPEAFAAMVARGYPAIANPGTVRFLGLREVGGRLVERLSVVAPDGSSRLFDYEMVETDGGWRINGVTPVAQGPAV